MHEVMQCARATFVVTATMMAALVAAGCGNSHSTGPSGGGQSVAGTWAYSASTASGSSISCTVSATMAFTQSGNTFDGTYSDGSFTCATPDGPVSETNQSGQILDGTVNGSAVSFDVADSAFHNTGTLSGGSISGTATITQAVGATTYTLTGTFTAARN